MSFGGMGSMGRGYGRASVSGGKAGGSSGTAPSAPTLVWTSASSDNTPNYTVTLPIDAQTGDIVYLEESDNISFNSTSTNEVDAGELFGGTIAVESVSLADGTYYARSRIRRGANYGPYSNVVTVTISTFTPRVFGLVGPLPGFISTTAVRSYGTSSGFVTETK